MCIIIIKPAGRALPDPETLRTCWNNNRDGAGLMYHADGAVHIVKGLMSYSAVTAALDAVARKIDVTAAPMVLHFRIGTHGGNTPENTHPFPITDHVGLMQKLAGKCTLAVAHNGIITSVTPRPKISDTMEYVATQLAPLAKLNKTFYARSEGKALMLAATQSKLAFMDADGKIETVGDFIEDDGLLFSNHSYAPVSYYSKFDYSLKAPADSFPVDSAYLMPLCDADGYVIDRDGNLESADDYMIDDAGRVYWYDYDEAIAIYYPDMTARNHAGGPLLYNADLEEWTEIILWDA